MHVFSLVHLPGCPQPRQVQVDVMRSDGEVCLGELVTKLARLISNVLGDPAECPRLRS